MNSSDASFRGLSLSCLLGSHADALGDVSLLQDHDALDGARDGTATRAYDRRLGSSSRGALRARGATAAAAFARASRVSE